MEPLLPISQRELTRLEVIQRVKGETLKQRQAAELLSLSVRQVKRLCKAYQHAGAAGLISKRRGRPANHCLPKDKQQPLAYTIYQAQEQQQGKVIESNCFSGGRERAR